MMSQFKYVGKKLFAENLSILNIIKTNKTPFYLYSDKQLAENYSKLANCFKKKHRISKNLGQRRQFGQPRRGPGGAQSPDTTTDF